MRIFLVCADPGIAPDGTKGASVHLRSVAAALRRAGHDVVAFTGRPLAPGGRFPVPRRSLSPDALARAATAEGRPDVVYERYTLGHDAALRAARELGAPFALEVNAPLVLEARRYRPVTLSAEHVEAEERLFRRADVVLAVSEPLREHVASVRGTADGTRVLRNGCDPTLYPSPAALGTTGGEVVAFLGHPRPWHGADALPALLDALRRRGRDVRLLVIGGGRGAEAVVREAARLRVDDRVTVTGPVPPERAAGLLSTATVAVAPYPPMDLFYFCPLKVIEAMAAGVPTVSTRQGDLPDIVGPAGILVPPGDLDALAVAVERLLREERLRRRLGERARARALRWFTWDRVASALVEALRELRPRLARVPA